MTITAACYGFPVAHRADPDARAILDDLLDASGPPRAIAPGSPTVTIDVVVHDRDGESSDPPHTLETIAADPIRIDTGRSGAVVDPRARHIAVSLSRHDLDDPIVWGRWILERALLYLVCRSDEHYPLHAGGLRIRGRDVLVGAATGTGKSTLCGWALADGAVLAGEDIMVRRIGDGRDVHGLPQVCYVDEKIAVELGAPSTPIAEGGKHRVSLASTSRPRDPRLTPDVAVFLSHAVPGDGPSARPVDLAEAVDRCRDDVLTGKPADAADRIEEDLRSLLRGIPLWDLAVTTDRAATMAAFDALVDG